MALLSITSHHQDYHSHNTIGLHRSEIVNRQSPAPAHQSLKDLEHGTRVVVRDLFGNMPVRVKQRAVVAAKHGGNNKEWDELKRNVVHLLLSWPRDIATTLREVGTLQKLVIRGPLGSEQSMSNHPSSLRISKICNLLSQSSILHREGTSSWVEVSLSTELLQINGAISLDPVATKHAQFISFGIEPVVAVEGYTILHDEINNLFSNSAFGDEEADNPDDRGGAMVSINRRHKSDGYTGRQLKGGRKGIDKWPMYCININAKLCSTNREILSVEDLLDSQRDNLTAVIELLQAMIIEFLVQHQFRPKQHHRVRFQGDPNIENISPRIEAAQTEVVSANLPRSASRPIRRTAASSDLATTISSGPAKDLLGVNIKLPSFRRTSSQIEHPFDTWTKVKSGTVSKNLPPAMFSDISLLSTSQSTKAQFDAPDRTALLSCTGRVIRRPFEELEIATPHGHSSGQKSANGQHSNSLHLGHCDDAVEWINPTTKVKSLVNRRTGHSVAEKKMKGHGLYKRFVGTEGSMSKTQSVREQSPSSSNTTPWISSILKSWENPVFAPVESAIPEASILELEDATKHMFHGHGHVCSHVDLERAFRDSSSISGRISKDSLKHAKIISQVDKKFILVKVNISAASKNSQVGLGQSMENDALLVVIDQHAADERIRIEALMEELCTPNKDSTGTPESETLTSSLEKPLTFEISSREMQLLRVHRNHFSRWGILYNLSDIEGQPVEGAKKLSHTVLVRSLPPGIVARCNLDPRLLVDLIRMEVWRCAENPPAVLSPITMNDNSHSGHNWLQRIHSCPPGLLEMLNSRACRSAIMFNDVLSVEQCENLVKKLANCMFPFQCAHGRPSLVPLLDLGTFDRRETKVVLGDGEKL